MTNLLNRAGVINSSPLISFDTFIDEDLSLIAYIITDIRNEKVFNLDKVSNMSIEDIIKELYTRKYKNPLEFFMKDEKDREFLDQCYQEFKENGEYLYKHAIATDFFEVIDSFKQAGDIYITILYHNDAQKYIIDNDPLLSTLNSISSSELKKLDRYSQFYFRYLDDANRYIQNMTRRTYYFSSSALNLNETNDNFKQSIIIDYLIDMKNDISIFDIYKNSITGKVLQ